MYFKAPALKYSNTLVGRNIVYTNYIMKLMVIVHYDLYIGTIYIQDLYIYIFKRL